MCSNIFSYELEMNLITYRRTRLQFQCFLSTWLHCSLLLPPFFSKHAGPKIGAHSPNHKQDPGRCVAWAWNTTCTWHVLISFFTHGIKLVCFHCQLKKDLGLSISTDFCQCIDLLFIYIKEICDEKVANFFPCCETINIWAHCSQSLQVEVKI